MTITANNHTAGVFQGVQRDSLNRGEHAPVERDAFHHGVKQALVLGATKINETLSKRLKHYPNVLFRCDSDVVIAKISVPSNISILELQRIQIDLMNNFLTYYCERVFIDNDGRVYMHLRLLDDSSFQNATIKEILYEVCILTSKQIVPSIIKELENRPYIMRVKDLIYNGANVNTLA